MSTMTRPELRWDFLLDQLCAQSAGISHAIAVSADGLLLASSRDLPRDNADQLSACTSGLASLCNGTAELMNAGRVDHTVIRMEEGLVLVMAVGIGSLLTVLAHKNADLAQVAFDTAQLIERAGATFVPDRRPGHG